MHLPLKDIFESNAVRNVFISGCFIIAGLLIFEAGVHTGLRKSDYESDFNTFYYNPAARASNEALMDPNARYVESHGAFGTIVDVDPPLFMLADKDGSEKAILVDSATVIRRMHDDVDPSDISVGDTALVIGTPNSSGEIQAELIRLMPSMGPML